MDEILDNAPCGYLSFTDDGKIVGINRTLKTLLGYPNEEFAKSHIEELLTISGKIFYNTHFFPMLRLHQKAEEVFLFLIAHDNSQVPVLANATRRQSGKIYLNECVFIPVWQRKKFEDELVQARKQAESALQKNEVLQKLTAQLEQKSLALDHKVSKLTSMNRDLVQFNKIITHDFQESIRKIEIFASKMLSANPSDNANELNKIIQAAQKLRRLTLSLQLYVELEDQQIVTNVNLKTLVNAAKEDAVKQLAFSDFDLEIENLPAMEGYQPQLQLMFYHLIENSILYRHSGRRLQIIIHGVVIQENIYRSLTDKYQYVDCLRIEYADNASGFEATYQDYVFGLLKKLETKGAGLGMGLAICKRVAENHSGSIKVSSRPGEGSKFQILLPLRIQAEIVNAP